MAAELAESFVSTGLLAYARGDMRTALRAWLQVPQDDVYAVYAAYYIDFVRDMLPELSVHMENINADEGMGIKAQRVGMHDVKGALDGWQAIGAGAAKQHDGAGLNLVAQWAARVQSHTQSAADMSPAELETKLEQALNLDNFGLAYELAKQILSHQPAHARATEALQSVCERLRESNLAEIGDLQQVPQRLMSPEQVIWLNLDHRAGYVLAQIDGTATWQEVITLCGFDEMDALGILADIKRRGVVGDVAG